MAKSRSFSSIELPANALYRSQWATAPAGALARAFPAMPGLREVAPIPHTIGFIANRKSHLNQKRTEFPEGIGGRVIFASPRTKTALAQTVADFAARRVDLIVIDGGDGTIRDVLTLARHAFSGALPKIAVLPSGKTNALALDLGIPTGWSADGLVAALRNGRTRERAPVEIYRQGSREPDHVGFLFVAGAFVQATALAQRTHRMGAFNGLAVGMSLGWSILQTMFGSATNKWRVGETMTIDAGGSVTRPFYILLGSTLERLPLGLKPFGRQRTGMKLLAVDAPPRKMPTSVPLLISGSESESLDRAGYHRTDMDGFGLTLDSEFILDGERYPGGVLTIRKGTPLQFVVP